MVAASDVTVSCSLHRLNPEFPIVVLIVGCSVFAVMRAARAYATFMPYGGVYGFDGDWTSACQRVAGSRLLHQR